MKDPNMKGPKKVARSKQSIEGELLLSEPRWGKGNRVVIRPCWDNERLYRRWRSQIWRGGSKWWGGIKRGGGRLPLSQPQGGKGSRRWMSVSQMKEPDVKVQEQVLRREGKRWELHVSPPQQGNKVVFCSCWDIRRLYRRCERAGASAEEERSRVEFPVSEPQVEKGNPDNGWLLQSRSHPLEPHYSPMNVGRMQGLYYHKLQKRLCGSLTWQLFPIIVFGIV